MIRLSEIITEQMSAPSPIRQIMQMADRKNIINMGLNPDDVISFGGGWVNHEAPEGLRKKYVELVSDKKLFHKTGGYTATKGDSKCLDALVSFEKEIFRMKDISAENIIIGQSSTQLTFSLLLALANPSDSILLLDPTYANYEPQINLALRKPKIFRLNVLNEKEWTYVEDADFVMENMKKIMSEQKPKIIVITSPDNPTGKILPDKFVSATIEVAKENGAFVIIDHAYKTLYFNNVPRHFSLSPNEHENLITLHSNSKWSRSLGRRMGWIEASKDIISAMENIQQSTILCPDTLHQTATTNFINDAVEKNVLKKYMDVTRRYYKKAAEFTISCVKKYLSSRFLKPDGGLYTVVDVGKNGDEFVMDILKKTGVLFIPGSGFGNSLKNAVRISYGPLVHNLDKIKEGFERVQKVV